MMKRIFRRYASLSLLSFLGAFLFLLITATPSQAHWADLAAAEIVVNSTEVQMTLTFPTGLTPFADDNQSGQLSPDEVHAHVAELQTFLNEHIHLTDSSNTSPALTVQPIERMTLSPTVLVAPNTHSTLLLNYAWAAPIQGLKIHYNLFVPDVSTASCLATVLHDHQLKTFVFTPKSQILALTPGLPGLASGGLLLAIAGSFLWGAAHSLSPGHGKTVVGAYLVGTRATPQHALFLAATTTITHTIGVFALGLITLFAARFILPDQLYPWMSLLSGLMVVAIGCNLLLNRFRSNHHHSSHKPSHRHSHQHSQNHSHEHLHQDICNHSHEHSCEHSHEHLYAHVHKGMSDRQIYHSHDHHPDHEHHPDHSPNHSHSYDHDHHTHSHLPPDADGLPVTWRSLLLLGISGGLIPCPAALVLLLSSIALSNVSLGLLLVLAFSLGLAGVLTGLGLLLVYTKRLFHRLPTQIRFMKFLPAFSALSMILIGFGISTRSFLQIIR